jgi:DNA-binding HxlR family transcriptional regulator
MLIFGKYKSMGMSLPITTKCKHNIMAMHDALDLLTGKWRVSILMALIARETLHFSELKKELTGLSGKVLTQELKDMESHRLIERIPVAGVPLKVEYRLTEHGKGLEKLLSGLLSLGLSHRLVLTGKDNHS